MTPERHNRKLDPCPKCRGTMAFVQDQHGPYLHCLNCGMLIDLAPFLEDPPRQPPGGPGAQRDRSGQHHGPRSQKRRDRNRRWAETIEQEGLSVRQAEERFGVGYRTLYRALRENRPKPTGPGDPGWTRRIITRAATYRLGEAATFDDPAGRHGDLSNLSAGYSLIVNGIGFQSPEGLYQALKFPRDPGFQGHIASRPSADEAVVAAYQTAGFRASWWERMKVKAMMYTQAVRLRQHPGRFSGALMVTGDLPIVKVSSRDPFWGARPEPGDDSLLRGANVMGKLLTELRDELIRQNGDSDRAAGIFLEGVNIDSLLIDGKPLPGRPEATGGPDSVGGTA